MWETLSEKGLGETTPQERKREYQRKYRAKHSEEYKRKARKYQAKRYAEGKLWFQTHREEHNKNQRERLAAKRRRDGVKEYPLRGPGNINTDALMKIYYNNRDATWKELAELAGISVPLFKTKVGLALIEECRRAEECPMKALLPEYKEEKK